MSSNKKLNRLTYIGQLEYDSKSNGYYINHHFDKKNFHTRIFFNLRNDCFDFDDADTENLNKNTLNCDENFYEIREGDVLKLGKYYLKIRSINLGRKVHDVDKIMSNNKLKFNKQIMKFNSKKTLNEIAQQKISSLYKVTTQEGILNTNNTNNGENIIMDEIMTYENDFTEENRGKKRDLIKIKTINIKDKILSKKKNKMKKEEFGGKKEKGEMYKNEINAHNNIMTNANLSNSFAYEEQIKRKGSIGENDNSFNEKNNMDILDKVIKIESNLSLNNKQNVKHNTSVCRVCYTEEDDEVNNPLVSPCKCIGGVKYIHLKCLQNWIGAKANEISLINNENCKEFKVSLIKCEICNFPYPDFIYNNKHKIYYELFDCINFEFKNYIVF